MIYKTKGPKETQKIASELAKKILKSGVQKHAVTIALEGELGAGKTTFIKGFAKTLGIKAHITSPTFVILKNYKLPASPKLQRGEQTTNYKLLVHIDAYRLKNYRDLISLGLKETMANPENIILIEWSERVKPIIPSKHIGIHIDHTGKDEIKISVKNVTE